MKKRYNHLYALGFSVDSNHPEGATEGEVLLALRSRLVDMKQTGEALEAVGVPEETIDNGTGLEVAQRSEAPART
jgi:ATP phosphoribosyltransferase